jgi:hypothetical protein
MNEILTLIHSPLKVYGASEELWAVPLVAKAFKLFSPALAWKLNLDF